MNNFTNPLDKLRIASPCAADWDEMQGDARKRFCGECKLNVYKLSAMTKREAETLLVNSEGRLCVRFYRRADGTILTRNCPVGWAKVKQRASRIATATFSLIAGFFGGFWSFTLLENVNRESFKNAVVETMDGVSKSFDKFDNADLDEIPQIPIAGEAEFIVEEGRVEFDDSLFTLGQNRSGLAKAAKRAKNAGWANGRIEAFRVSKAESKGAKTK